MESLELVVARYQEDLNWLRRVPKRFLITVYDKGKPCAVCPRRRGLTQVVLPNTGREDQAYLEHIVSRYDQLADVTVFAQGRPFDHVPSFHKVLHQLAFSESTVLHFSWLGFIIDEDDPEGSLLFQLWSKNPDRDPLPMNDFWRALWDEDAPERKAFYAGAHFAVTAETIRRKPRAFYERALRLSAELSHAAHCFERAWDRVFDLDGIPEAYRFLAKPIYLRKIRRASPSDVGQGTV